MELLKPIKVGNKVLRNRIVMPPMEERLNDPDGGSRPEAAAYYGARARGGAGMIIVGNTFVDDKASRSSFASSGLYSNHLIPSKYRLSHAIKEEGAVAIIQLSHGGIHGGQPINAGFSETQPLGPSADAKGGSRRAPRELTIPEILEIEDAFAQAALRAKYAEFDGVEIHCAHGYLLNEFLSPYSNHRTDAYGGSAENRQRMLRETIEKVRAAVGRDFIVGVRISGDEYVEGGLRIEDNIDFIRNVQEHISYVNVSAGNYDSQHRWGIPSTYADHAPVAHLAAAMKQAVSIPVLTVNSITPALGEQLLKDGKADMVAFGRTLIADPEMPRKLYENRIEDIRPCMRGNEGCLSLFATCCPMRCEVNPEVGREMEGLLRRTEQPKKVVVIGGGMAGMEAARVAALVGHQVTLFERTSQLGGHFIEATRPVFKDDALRLLRWLICQVEKSGIDLRMNTAATPEAVCALNPDAILVATGSQYITLPIPGIEYALRPDAVLNDLSRAGERVAVIGGGLIGTEVALQLGLMGRQVSVVELLPGVAMQDEPNSRKLLLERLAEERVELLTECAVTEVREHELVYRDSNGELHTLPVDTVVAATGLRADTEAAAPFLELAPKVVRIGDSVKAGKIFNAFHDAWNAVRHL